MRYVILATVALALGGGAWAAAGGGCCAGESDAAMTCPVSGATVAAATTKPTTRPAGETYVCPMGCAKSEKPGKCPKCGMDLVKQAQS